MINDKVLRI